MTPAAMHRDGEEMLTLGDFQAAFARALLHEAPACNDASHIARLVAQPGFAVYRNTVMKGCIDALRANYPVVARLVGDEWFRAAAAVFVRTNLPQHPSLVDYGEEFAGFLTSFEPAVVVPYLAAVARLERFRTEAHIAADAMPVDAWVVAALDGDALGRTVLRPHPAARWQWFDAQPTFTIWRRHAAEPGPSEPGNIDWSRGEGVLIVRPHGAVHAYELSAAGSAFLDACARRATLLDAATAALSVDAATDLTQLLALLLETGAFGELDADSADEAHT